jgi:hypothetical protein
MTRRQFIRRTAVGAAAVGAAAVGLSGVAKAETGRVICGQPKVTPLTAGQNMVIGTVTVSNDGEYLYVTYDVTEPGWCIKKTHVHVGLTLDDIPQTPQNHPIPGHFDYHSGNLDPCVTSYEQAILWSNYVSQCGNDVVVAAHAEVEYTDPNCANKGTHYGIERFTGKVYGSDPLSGTSWYLFTIPLGGNSASPNGLGYDANTNRFYYTDYKLPNPPGTTPDTLYFWDGTNHVTAGQLSGTIACGDIDNGKYYYIPNGTDDLYEVVFNPDGTVLSDTKLADISGNSHHWTFSGDIAVKDGIVYGWGLCGVSGHRFEYFTYDIANSAFTIHVPTYQSSLQLAFGSDGVLYGHRSGGAGEFYAVDTANGNVTMITPTPSPVRLYTDTASGGLCETQEETAFGGDIPGPGNRWWFYIKYTVQCCEPPPQCYQEETAWAANGQQTPGQLPYEGATQWATYVQYDGQEKMVDIYAGQTIPVGKAYFSAPFWFNGDGKVTIQIFLTGSWEFNVDMYPPGNIETLKIQDYPQPPSGNPSPGLFDWKFPATGTTYTMATVPLNNFYGVHLDVRKEKPCP